jgi:enoyl-[acyl-carrier protein] reductase I
MNFEKIHGLIDAPFTPFYENGEVNYEPIPAYAALLVRNGLQGVFINGSSGEGYMLTEEERMKLAKAWVSSVPEDFKESMEKLGGKIDFVLHSIGMSPNVRKHRTYDDLDYGYLQKTLDISAISFHKMLQVAKKQDAIADYGSVVALTYVASQRTFFGYNDMADAKSMLESIARSFGYIYGREKHVRVNTISQSPTATTAGKGIKEIDNMMDFADKMSPLGNADAEECANYCVVMFSDFTRKVTMQNLFHDGGFSNMGMSLRAMNQYSKDLKPFEDENGKIIYG